MSDVSNWDVIIVDDEPDNIGVVKLVLEFHNATVRVAESGKECLTLMKQQMPSLLLMDIQMPEMSGYDLLDHIRANTDWKHIPIIAVTAFAMTEDWRQIIGAGFDGHIPKPLNVGTLIDEIQEILEKRRSRTKHG